MSCEFTARAQSSNSSRFNDLIPTLDGSSWRQMLSVAALNMEISPTNLSSTHQSGLQQHSGGSLCVIREPE